MHDALMHCFTDMFKSPGSARNQVKPNSRLFANAKSTENLLETGKDETYIRFTRPPDDQLHTKTQRARNAWVKLFNRYRI